jgi:hypothetical protein
VVVLSDPGPSASPGAQRLADPMSRRAHPIWRRRPSVPERGGRSSEGERTGRRRATAKGPSAGRRALEKLSASARQIGIRQGTSVRVKQSKSQQIVANAYPSASTTFAMRSCLRGA